MNNSPFNIQFDVGGDGDAGALTAYACKHGLKKLAVLYLDAPGVKELVDNSAVKIAPRCGAKVKTYAVNPQTADLGATATQALTEKPNYVLLEFGPAVVQVMLKTLNQAGFPADHILLNSGSADVKTLKGFGSAGNGIHIDTVFKSFANTKDREIGLYRKAMRKYTGTSGESDQNLKMFARVMTIRAACEKIGFTKCTPKALLDFLNGKRGLGLHIFASRSIEKPPKGYFSIKTKYATVSQWKNGKLSSSVTVKAF
jgi:ABC-type branched-subunit amino acid transport system substrate-binding protein